MCTALLLLVGCGDDFDAPSKLQSLRVMAVKKDLPYGRPGEDVTLTMLWHDASAAAPRSIQRAWISGCFNPRGDLYFNCFSAGESTDPAALPLGWAFTEGDSVTVSLPGDIISSRPALQDDKQPRYGVAIVFFFACAGQVGPAPPAKRERFPIACYDANGRELGASEFTAGFTQINAYEALRNENPRITGFAVNGRVAPIDCQGEACLNAPPPVPIDCATGDVRCVRSCADDGHEDCPGIDVVPLVDKASAEVNEALLLSSGERLTEQLWVNYYSDRGGIDAFTKIVSSSDSGFNESYGTEFFAPRNAGPVQLWATVHDSRGGAEWVRLRLFVE